MRTKVTVIFDTSNWAPDSNLFQAGFDQGINIICDNDEETKKALENVYGLGHSAEVTYLED